MIELKEISFGYAKKSPLFEGLNLSLSQGSICGLLGKNGAGKTTLLKIIAGLLFTQQGDCTVMGDIPKKRNPEFLSDLYFIPEEFYVPALSAKEYLKLYAPFYPKFSHEFFNKHMEEFSLNTSKKLTELSHGQKKKFLLAFGLATQSKLFILDEPTNGLDIPSKSQFRKMLAQAMTDERLFIISTHQVRDVENLIDRVVLLEEGAIIFNQALSEVSQKLSFTREDNAPAADECLYAEKGLGGYTVVNVNKTGIESNIDLELLFNTVLADPKRIQNVFSYHQSPSPVDSRSERGGNDDSHVEEVK